MWSHIFVYNLCFIHLWIETVTSSPLLNKHSYFMDNSDSESDVADFIVAKGYLPSERELPKPSLVKNYDNDVTYLLSRLSDEELIKLLNDQPKKNLYDLNDIVKVAVDPKSLQGNKLMLNDDQSKLNGNLNLVENKISRYHKVLNKDKPQSGFFRLENKPIDAYGSKSEADLNYGAIQKLNTLLINRPIEETEEKSDEDDTKKELLFDVLVAQLKTLCCKKSKPKKHEMKKIQYKSLLEDAFVKPNVPEPKSQQAITLDKMATEYMFLIINDEIKSNGSDELISVDPESLEKNSSVLLLGPITTPLTDPQLKSVMTRISTELSKPDYLSLLQQLSDGTLSGNNIRLMKSLVTGPETRRYIKPHRCNHQSKLARVFGGPKWLICTGYLNINAPSLYD